MAGGGAVSNIRVGIVGAGAIAQIAHLPVLRKLKGVQVVGICDNDGPKARALAARFETGAAYDDIEELLELARVDAVVICTPNHLHEAHAISAMAAGAHVLVERPLALSAAGVTRILKAAERYKRTLLVAMNSRFRADVQAVQGFLKGGELGPLSTIRCGWQVFRTPHLTLGWRSRRAESGGGVMMDLGLPMLDLALWIAGTPTVERVSAFLDRTQGKQVDEIAAAHLFCDGGLSVFCDVSWRHVGEGERTWLDVQGTKGSASISPLRVFKELHGVPVDVTPTGAIGRENPFSASYRSEWAYFLAAIQGEVQVEPPEDQLQLHKVLEAIYRSADEQRDIKL
ncbi:MAG TPA: Gfo/Idh/MocA family oxidoreductase [Gemmatimonadales bacterium]|nr:Gfo/Idh/MocA family oxidoreductase [Gemmatimonadales bacterium]